jgi:hypothetical protein
MTMTDTKTQLIMTDNDTNSDPCEPLMTTPNAEYPSQQHPKGEGEGDDKSTQPRRRRGFFWWLKLLFISDLALHMIMKWVNQQDLSPRFKRLVDGSVAYSIQESEEYGRLYHRDVKAPCGYGILTFAVGPASENLPCAFDVYSSEFSFYNGYCLFNYDASHMRNYPFVMPDDALLVTVPFQNWTRISSQVIDFPHSEPVRKAVTARCGDYAIVSEGNFYDADFYQDLIDAIHNWTVDDSIVGRVGALEEQ